MLAAILGAGPVADAFFVALRLPNHFRAIFAEGAFNAAFVPAYARIRGQGGRSRRAAVRRPHLHAAVRGRGGAARGRAVCSRPTVIGLLAPGFARDPGRFALAVELTRITFPYLLLVCLVTLYGGILNALQRFAAAAAAPILLNLSMMATLALAAFFPTAGHAAAWGVLLAGVPRGRAGRRRCRAARRAAGVPARSCSTTTCKRFFKALGPATLGSGGTQIALFADTIIASFLAAGALSALYYADRLNQLPIGVIGIAVGTVLLPEMASRIARGDEAGARHAQNRAIELTLLMSIPCLVAFLLVPDLIMRALFARGAFTARRRGGGRRDARRLHDRPRAVRADPQRHRRPSWRAATPRRRSRRCWSRSSSTSRFKIALMGDLCPGRAGARDLDRRLDQFRPGAVVRRRAGMLAARRPAQGLDRQARRGRRSRSRSRFAVGNRVARAGCRRTGRCCARAGARGARRARRRRLWRARSRSCSAASG